jgi:hypothetical protein
LTTQILDSKHAVLHEAGPFDENGGFYEEINESLRARHGAADLSLEPATGPGGSRRYASLRSGAPTGFELMVFAVSKKNETLFCAGHAHPLQSPEQRLQ